MMPAEGGSRPVPAEDGSRIEAEVAGVRHELIDSHPHLPEPAAAPATPPATAHHPPDPNAGVVRATPPDARALLLGAAVAAITLLALLLVAIKVS